MALGPKDTTTVTISALKDLKDRSAKAGKLEKDLKKEKAVTAKLETDIKTLEENCATLKQECDAMAVDVTIKVKKIQELEKKLNEAPAQSAESPKTTKPKVKKADLNQELVNHVNQTTKTVLFRTCKFIEDALEEEEVTRELIPYLPVDIGMPEADFVANYKNVVYEAIKGCRTEVQSSGKKRAKGKNYLCKLPESCVIFQTFCLIALLIVYNVQNSSISWDLFQPLSSFSKSWSCPRTIWRNPPIRLKRKFRSGTLIAIFLLLLDPSIGATTSATTSCPLTLAKLPREMARQKTRYWLPLAVKVLHCSHMTIVVTSGITS